MHNEKTNYIGGQWIAAASGETFTSTNPADATELLGVYARSRATDVAAAVEAAQKAYPAWRKLPPPARAAILSKLARILETRKEAMSQQMTLEMGKVLTEARGDVQEAIDMAHYMAAFGRLPNGQLVPSERPEIFCAAKRVPLGVVGLITPWNFPIAVPTWKMFPALLAGNTAVWKPAEDTPGMAVSLVEALEEAGVPEGVVNLVTGYGDEAGAALVEAEGVAAISFTGSTAIGRKIAARCGELLKRVSCELGGKNAITVLADADIELAVKGALWSAFGTAGQRCTAASRLIIDKKIRGEFTERLVSETAKLKLGIGVDPEAQIGPVVNQSQLKRIHGYVELGQEEGARLIAGGGALTESPLDKGSFYAPTIFDGVTPSMRIAQEEIFGPVTAIIEADGLDDALAIANGTNYGLSLSLYTRDLRQAMRAMDDLESGIVYVNLPTSGAEIQLPFGGIKDTGNGHREAGWMAMDWCTEWKAMYVNYAAGSDLVRAQIDTVEN
ncbi:MAG: aldehyde dehydrogenase family protein [Armatimonas sp.]